jgi:outer membrane protein assembly factor BamD
MASQFPRFLYIVVTTLSFCSIANASVIFKPGEKAKYVAPGEEEINGNAEQLFHIAQEAEKNGNMKRAINAYRSILRKYPKDALAPGAGFRRAELLEQTHAYLPAAEAYRLVVEKYPTSPHFNEAIEAQFRIGEMYLNGKKIKMLGVSVANSFDKAVEIFAAVIRTAPYGKYTARAQFDIGRAREKEGASEAALQAYQAVVEKFPNSPVAPDAQYQLGYIWFMAARAGTKDLSAATKARTAFQDFLYRFPNSEKAAQTRANLLLLDHKQTSSSLDIAKYYDKQKYYRAAVIYYNEVIRQQPGSNESQKAKQRLDELTRKLGENALKPPAQAAAEEAAKNKAQSKAASSEAAKGEPGPRGSANDSAPLPPPAESDPSLPPPASLMPDATTASPSLGDPLNGSSSLAPSATSEPSPAPDASASPAP